jgi:hypothetical protein
LKTEAARTARITSTEEIRICRTEETAPITLRTLLTTRVAPTTLTITLRTTPEAALTTALRTALRAALRTALRAAPTTTLRIAPTILRTAAKQYGLQAPARKGGSFS